MMVSRFRVSKYKNLSVKLPQVNCNFVQHDLLQTPGHGCSNWISSGALLYAYLSNSNDKEVTVSSLHESIHNDQHKVTGSKLHSFILPDLVDLSFNPFHDDLLGLLTFKGLSLKRFDVKPDTGPKVYFEDSIEVNDFALQDGTDVFGLKWHPTVDSILAVANIGSGVELYDLAQGSSVVVKQFSVENQNRMKTFAFDYLGSTIAIGGTLNDQSTNLSISLFDVRCSEQAGSLIWPDVSVSAEARVDFVNTTTGYAPHFITSSLDTSRHQKMALWDRRTMKEPLKHLLSCELSNQIFIPHCDPYTGLMYFLTKNVNSIAHLDMNQLIRTETGVNDFTSDLNFCQLPYTVKGGTLVPKRAMNLMESEIDRLLVLTNKCVYPVSYNIPRKNTNDFHSDLYPPVRSLNPILKKQFFDLTWNPEDLNQGIKYFDLNPHIMFSQLVRVGYKLGDSSIVFGSAGQTTTVTTTTDVACSSDLNSQSKLVTKVKQSSKQTLALKKRFNDISAMCRFITSKQEKAIPVTNVQTLYMPTCEPFKVGTFALYPYGTQANGCTRLAMINVRKPHTYVGTQPHILCPTTITAFDVDPFQPNIVACGLLNGYVKLYKVQLEQEHLEEPPVIDKQLSCFLAHESRITMLHYNPAAEQIVATVGSDNRVKISSMTQKKVHFSIEDFGEDKIFSIAWNKRNGCTKLAVLCRSQSLYVYDVLRMRRLVRGGTTTKGNVGRCCWVLEDQAILVSGYTSLNEREFTLFSTADLTAGPLANYTLNASPSILVPFFDEDTQTLFLTGRGDQTIYCFELAITESETPTTTTASTSGDNDDEVEQSKVVFKITPLNSIDLPTPHQAVWFENKSECNVGKMEIAKGYRLTLDSIEPFNVTIPRRHPEYFHDDLFPPTVITWKPAYTDQEWLTLGIRYPTGDIPELPRMSLKPPNSENYSDVKDRLEAEKLEKQQKKAEAVATGDAVVGVYDDGESAAAFGPIGPNVAAQDRLLEQLGHLMDLHGDDEEIAPNNTEQVEGVDSDEWED